MPFSLAGVFYPLQENADGVIAFPENTKYRHIHPSGNATSREARSTPFGRNVGGEDSLTELTLPIPPEYCVHIFPFLSVEHPSSRFHGDEPVLEGEEGGPAEPFVGRCIPPKRVCLSPNKRLLLLLGASFLGQSSLLVYQIMESASPFSFFPLIFYDLAMNYIDACFAPDNRRLASIPARLPTHLFLFYLPLISVESRRPSSSSNASMSSQEPTNLLSPTYDDKVRYFVLELRRFV